MDIKTRLKQLEIESNQCTEIKKGNLVVRRGMNERYNRIKKEYIALIKQLG